VPPSWPLAGLVLLVWLLVATGAVPVWSGLVHLVALPPIDLVADLGVLLSRAEHPVVFVLGAAVSIGVRSAVVAAMLGRADLSGWLLALRFYAVVAPGALVAASLLYGAHAVLFYALFWFGVAATLVLVSIAGAAPWMAAGRVREGFRDAARRWFRLGTVWCYLLGLVLLGYAASAGSARAVLLVPVSGGWTWAAVRWLRSDPGAVVLRRSGAAIASLGVAGMVVLAAAGPASPPDPAGAEPARDGSLVLMSGIDSSSGSGAVLELDPRSLGYGCDQTHYFSYAGTGPGQPAGEAVCPIDHGAPYGPEDTMRSRDEVIPFIEEQVAALDPPVVILAHSQAAWMAWLAAAEGRLGADVTLVLIGAFPENPVTYPPDMTGWQTAPGRLVLQPLSAIPRPGGGTTAFEPDSPLGREWLASPGAVRDALSEPLPDGVRALSVSSTFDLPLKPGGHRIDGATDACPVAVIHPNLPYAPEVGRAVGSFVDGASLDRCPAWREVLGRVWLGFTVAPS
jgi:hypothetical protein